VLVQAEIDQKNKMLFISVRDTGVGMNNA